MRSNLSDTSVCHYRLSRVEYDRAVEAGAFEPTPGWNSSTET